MVLPISIKQAACQRLFLFYPLRPITCEWGVSAVLKGVAELNFGNFSGSQIDLFGDAYEFLISNYAANAGKSGGEFFTPQTVSKLIAQLAMHGQSTVNKIYDPACGSGPLLLQAKKPFDAIVSNLPYSVKWVGSDEPTLINDERFALSVR